MRSLISYTIVLSSIILCSTLSLYAIDNVHFYRPNFFWGEPRLECPWLTTGDVALGGGSARHSFNGNGKETGLLNIFGLQNMHHLADNVTSLNPNNRLDKILIDLNAVPDRSTFGTLKLQGTFHIIESTFSIYQNILNGFFFQLYVPARKMIVNPHLTAENLPTYDETPNYLKTTPEWQAFLNNFFSILRSQDLSVESFNRSGIGDLSLLAGWAHSHLDNNYLDFIDVAAKIGVLFPTGQTRNPNQAFALPFGYDGHWGVPLKFDLSFGLWEWFTCGLHIGSLYLAHKKKEIRIQTSPKQNGFIKLAKEAVNVDPGIYFDFDIFAKADHFCRGLSLVLAYSFNAKQKDSLELHHTEPHCNTTFHDDPFFASWNQHVLNFFIEYDFAQKKSAPAPRIAFFYNTTLAGKRVFDTYMAGGALGIDIAWCF